MALRLHDLIKGLKRWTRQMSLRPSLRRTPDRVRGKRRGPDVVPAEAGNQTEEDYWIPGQARNDERGESRLFASSSYETLNRPGFFELGKR
jgi:hypothetical protein